MGLTLPEEVLLLLLHDVRGKPLVDGTALNAALAGAVLVELTLDGALRLTEVDEPQAKRGRLVATGRPPRDQRLAGLAGPLSGKKPKDAVSTAIGWGWGSGSGRAKGLREGLLADLAGRGMLTRERGSVLGFIPTTSWPQGHDHAAEDEVVARVRRALLLEEQPDTRTAALISVLTAVDGLPKIFPEANKKALKHRGREISQSDWAGKAVRDAVEQVHAAMVAVTVATMAAGASSS